MAEWSMAVVLKNSTGNFQNSRFSLQTPHATADGAQWSNRVPWRPDRPAL